MTSVFELDENIMRSWNLKSKIVEKARKIGYRQYLRHEILDYFSVTSSSLSGLRVRLVQEAVPSRPHTM